MKDLYPLKFNPILKDKIWGGSRLRNILYKEGATDKCGESWEISGLEGDISVVSDGFLRGNNLQETIEIYMGDLVGDKVYEKFGIEFPILIKFIDASETLSIQVHPGDELARTRHNAYGKTEMWYIIEKQKDSKLISGFNREITKQEYLDYFHAGKITDILNYVDVESGDIFFMPAGRVHAIGSGILLAEIHQTSDVTYRIYDWDKLNENGEPRELHTDLALDVIDFKQNAPYKFSQMEVLNKTDEAIDCNYFTTNVIRFDKPVIKDYSLIDSFTIYICTEGAVKINCSNQPSTSMRKGEVVLVPASLKQSELIPMMESVLLEVYLK